jgi:hypothetical protein
VVVAAVDIGEIMAAGEEAIGAVVVAVAVRQEGGEGDVVRDGMWKKDE